MDPDFQKFGRGPRELTGAVDLINHYKLLPHLDFFCKRSLPVSVSDTHYLHDVVGDTEVRKGEGMQLGQLVAYSFLSKATNSRIRPFELDILREAFQLKDSDPISLPTSEKGVPTVSGKSKSESKGKKKKHKKHRDKDKERTHKKHKHHHKDRSKNKSKDKEKKKLMNGHHDFGYDHTKKPHDKKRKNDGDADAENHKHKKKKHKSSKIDDVKAIKVAG